MGTWSVESVHGRHESLNTSIEYGHNWYVTFRIKYTPSGFGAFVEPPKMAWDEVIFFNDYSNNERWEFSGNLYVQKADSPTMAVWAQRYFRAYLHAHNKPYIALGGKQKGHSKLFDLKGVAVTGAALGTHGDKDYPAQNKAVQNYLKSKGGIMEIEVHDIPCFLKNNIPGKEKNIERILIFNCGVTGIGPRVKAYQHIKMDTSQPPASWTCNFQLGDASPGIKTTNLKVVPDKTPKSDLLPEGGIW